MAKIDTGYRVGYVGEIGAQGKTPLEILDSVGDWQKPFLLKHWIPIFLGAAGIATAASSNWMARRPVMSGIQRHIGFGAGGFSLGVVYNGWRDRKYALRDARLRHYIHTHPEDFITPPRKKWGDRLVLEEWRPIR